MKNMNGRLVKFKNLIVYNKEILSINKKYGEL